CGKTLARALQARDLEHLGTEIDADDFPGRPDGALEFEREVPGPGRAVQDAGSRFGAAQLHAEPAPPMVQTNGQDLIPSIVAARDRGEHGAHLGAHEKQDTPDLTAAHAAGRLSAMTNSPQPPSGTARARRSTPVAIGSVTIGGGRPIAVQSMTNTDTADPKATADQA